MHVKYVLLFLMLFLCLSTNVVYALPSWSISDLIVIMSTYVHIADAVSVAVVLILGEVVRLSRWHGTLDGMMLRAVLFEPNITAAIVVTYIRTYCCFCCCACVLLVLLVLLVFLFSVLVVFAVIVLFLLCCSESVFIV